MKIKWDSTMDEIYALLVIKYIFPEIADTIYKWESPDWKSEDNKLGIEVTRAETKHIGYTFNVMTKYFGCTKDEIPADKLEKFKGWTYFENNRLRAIAPHKGLADGNLHITLLLEHLEKKLQKLNSPHFALCNQNYLFEFDTGCFSQGDREMFSCGIREKVAQHKFGFDKMIVSTYTDVFCFSPNGSNSFYTVPVEELNKKAVIYRMYKEWKKGDIFSF